MHAMIRNVAIKSNLTALKSILQHAVACMDKSTKYLEQSEIDISSAVGEILDLEPLLESAISLHRAAMFLHHRRKQIKI